MVLDKRPCISLGFLHLPQLLMTKKPHSKPQTWFCFRSDVMFFNWFFTEIVQPLHRKQNEGDLVCRIAVLFILKCSTTDNPSPPFSLFKGNYFPLTFFFFPSCHEIHKFLCTEIQKARIQNQLCELLSWSSFWMTHSLWALCQLLSELCASKTAGPVLTHAKSRNSWMFADHRAHTNKPRVDAVPPKCCLMDPWLPGQSACVIQKSMNSGL